MSVSASCPSRNTAWAALTLGALGVVYGDIGTSPLYTIKAIFDPSLGIAFSTANILGGLSTLFWSLMLVVSLKYVMLIMRADNEGEGGILALLALAAKTVGRRPRTRHLLTVLGVFGAALFYGDSVLTPAVTVLGAIEGLEVAVPPLKPYVLPISVVLVVALFAVQRRGTAVVGAMFGPVMLVWFAVLGLAGVLNIAAVPAVLQALNPMYAMHFVTQHGFASFLVLGAVFLAVTGAEALYADMGHFGKRPIQLAWFFCTFPALVLNYFGQGALLITNPQALENPFFLMFPAWAQLPMVGLSTLAAAIASQAVISGAYSITKQAIQLGLLPRTRIVQTSERAMGQIYVPVVNWLLFGGVLAAMIGFGNSTTLTFAYGLSVAGTMAITTVLTYFVIRHGWGYPAGVCWAATGFFLSVDLAFVAASSMKLVQGGWFPLALGLVLFLLMMTWQRGRARVAERSRANAVPLASFLAGFEDEPPVRTAGTGVFLTAQPDGVPTALLHNLKHNGVLHGRVVILSIETQNIPRVPKEDYIWIDALGHGFYRVRVHLGFMETPDIPQVLEDCGRQGLSFDLMQTSFFVNRESYVPTVGGGMAMWRQQLFVWMAHLAAKVTDYFRIPSNRVVELGSQVRL